MAKNTWFRFFNNVVNDPKVQRLQGETFKAWVNILCIASDNDGVLPSIPDLAFSLRMVEQETSELIDQLFRLGLLDAVEIEGGPMAYTPHNWEGRQFRSDNTDPTAPERMKRYRERQRNDRNATVTVTDTRADTEQIQNRTEKIDAGASDWPSNALELFWEAYPQKVGKAAAIAKLGQVRRRGVPWKAIMDGLDRYKRTKPADRPWCNPLTWLNQGRWEDAPDVTEMPATLTIAEIDWDAQVQRFLKGQQWSVKWYGSEPGQLGCKVPPEILAKYGLAA